MWIPMIYPCRSAGGVRSDVSTLNLQRQMKYATHLLISLCFSFILVSCDSNSGGDDNNDNNGIPLPGLLGTMRADVDGQSWNAITATASRFLNLPIPTILLAGVDLTGSGISIGFADVDGTVVGELPSNNHLVALKIFHAVSFPCLASRSVNNCRLSTSVLKSE